VRFTEEELENIVSELEIRAHAGIRWLKRYKEFMAKTNQPTMEMLEAFVEMSNTFDWTVVPEVIRLRDYLDKVYDVRNAVNVAFGRKYIGHELEPNSNSIITHQYLLELSQQLTLLNMDNTLEKSLLFGKLQQVDHIVADVNSILRKPPNKMSVSYAHSLLDRIDRIGVELDEKMYLEEHVAKKRFRDRYNQFLTRENERTKFSEVELLLEEAQSLGYNDHEACVRCLKVVKCMAEKWNERAMAIINCLGTEGDQPTIEVVHDLFIEGSTVAGDDTLYRKLGEIDKTLQGLLGSIKDLKGKKRKATGEVCQNFVTYDMVKTWETVLCSYGIAIPHQIESLVQEVHRIDDILTQVRKEFMTGRRDSDTIVRDSKENIVRIFYDIQNLINPPTGYAVAKAFCICRRYEQGFMVQCDCCGEWYHGTCIKIKKKDTPTDSSFICSVCDFSGNGGGFFNDKSYLPLQSTPPAAYFLPTRPTRPNFKSLILLYKNDISLSFNEWGYFQTIVSFLFDLKSLVINQCAKLQKESQVNTNRRLKILQHMVRALEGLDVLLDDEFKKVKKMMYEVVFMSLEEIPRSPVVKSRSEHNPTETSDTKEELSAGGYKRLRLDPHPSNLIV
jgi:hypothetical protein